MTFIVVLACLWFPTGILSVFLPAILWDPRNPAFGCEDLTVYAAIGDNINIVCPNKLINQEDSNALPNADMLYESVYLLAPGEEERYNNCDARDAKQLLVCDGASQQVNFYTLAVKETAGSLSVPTFKPGLAYYIIGTGFRTKQNKDDRVGGSCNNTDSEGRYKLRLKLQICSSDEVNVYKNCSRCMTTACYFKGCTKCSSWALSHDGSMTNKEGQCYDFYHRNCTNEKVGVVYKEERTELVQCPTTVAPTTPETTPRIETTVSSTKPKPQLGQRVSTEESPTRIYIVGFLSGFVFLILGILFGYYVPRLYRRHSRVRSSKFNNSIKSNGVSHGIANDAFDDATLVKASPVPRNKMKREGAVVVGDTNNVIYANHGNGNVVNFADEIQVSCETPGGGSDRGGSKDQKL